MGRTWTASQEAAMTLGGKTLLVSAAAGSGKTSVLTERIIRTLIDPDRPADLSRILVVTFTRAAAAELKGRIASALTEALAEHPGDRRLSQQLLTLGSADISTIDAYFQKVVRANFEQLGLPATFRIADESELLSLSLEIAEGVIEEFYTQYAPDDADDDPLVSVRKNAFAEVLDHLLSNRSDGKLPQTLLHFHAQFASFPEGIGLLLACAEDLMQHRDAEFFQTRFGAVLCRRLGALFSAFAKELEEHGKAIAADPDAAAKCHALLASDTVFCRAMCEAAAARSYARAQSVLQSFVTGRFPTVRNKPDAVARYQDWRANFRKSIAKAAAQVQTPPEVLSRQCVRTAELCEMLYRFYGVYEDRLMAEKKARGILEHNDVRALLYRLLTAPDGSPSAFADELSAQYDAVYIDEYQDVDLIQDRIFALIGRDKRFMVGDIKQSIYGFRGSDPSVFADYRRKMPLYTDPQADTADGNCVFMSENFRCNAPVIDFANRVCAFLFSASEESVGYRPQDDLVFSKNCESAEQPAVQVAVFDKPLRQENGGEDEAEDDLGRDEPVWVAGEISRLLREAKKDNGEAVAPSDIAILVRNRAHGAIFAKELEALGIPVAAEAAIDFLHEPIVTDLFNLLRAIDNPYRDIPLSEFLLSPLGGFSLRELTEIRAAAPRHKALFDALCACVEHTETALHEKITAFLQRFFAWSDRACVLPADRFLRLLYLDELLAPYADTPALLYVYDLSRIYQKNAFCGLYGFLRQIDKLLSGNAPSGGAGFAKAESAVTVMTVHHSKGLEFPVVFLSSCGSLFNRTDAQASLLFHKSVGCAAKLYDGTVAASESTPLREAVAMAIDEEQAEENIRTLYVALTRAREYLYVTGTLKGKWENALAAAELVGYGNRPAILSCNSYLSLILAALRNTNAPSFAFSLRHISHDEITRGVPLSEATPQETAAEPSADRAENTLAAHYAAVLQARREHGYDLAALNGLPTKIAASKIAPNLLDILQDEDAADGALEQQIELMRASTPVFSALLSARHRATAAEIGTATHGFLQFCDYANLAREGVEAECARLTELGFIDRQSAEIIDRDQLARFCQSNLMGWLQTAKTVRREQRFGIFEPLASLTRRPKFAETLGDNTLFVQGSIDLLLEMPDGELYLIDYKTDRISDEEQRAPDLLASRMKEAHGNQLSCYARAVKQLFGKTPDKTFIYSLPLGQALEIEIPQDF